MHPTVPVPDTLLLFSRSSTAPKPLCMYIHTVIHRLSASTHTNHTLHMAPQTHRNQENRTPICYPSVFRAVVCLVSMPMLSSLHYHSSFSAHLNSRQTNPALAHPVPHTAITPHVASPTHHPGQPVFASRRYPELLYVPLTASNTHIVLLPTKSLPFPACLTYSDVNPKFVQFRSHVSPLFSIPLPATGFPVTPTEPGPAPSPASGFRPSGLCTPISPAVTTGARNLGVPILMRPRSSLLPFPLFRLFAPFSPFFRSIVFLSPVWRLL